MMASENEPLPIVKSVRSVFIDGRYSDLTITYGDRTWNVHKLVVCTRSEYFRRACDSNFPEAQHGIVILEDEPNVVDAVLYYFYHSDYIGDAEHHLFPMILHMQVFELADKYLVKHLQSLALDKFAPKAKIEWASSEFANAINYAYTMDTSTTGVMKEILLGVVADHAAELFTNDAYEYFQGIVSALPEFLFDHSKNIATRMKPEQFLPDSSYVNWYKCPGRNFMTYNAVFAVSKRIPAKCAFTCLNMCTYNKGQEFWKNHLIGK